MNRETWVLSTGEETVPHVRGDEPHWDKFHKRIRHLFPTCVGMNRRR